MIVTNAFSLNMLPANVQVEHLHVARISEDDARGWALWGLESAVGHKETADVFAAVLDCEVPHNRVTLTLSPGQELLVGQYVGPRLPEGATSLPAGARIDWFLVHVGR